MKVFLRRLFRSIAVFAAAGLIGPLIRYVTWPPSADPSPFNMFIYQLVLLVWPAQPLAVVEATIGPFLGGVYAVGVNVLLFAVLGFLATPFARRGAWMLFAYAAVCGLVTWYALLWSGFDAAYLHLPALAAAFVFYALPFWLIGRAGGTRSAHGEPSRRTAPGAGTGGTRGG
jgi:hypothetical protein